MSRNSRIENQNKNRRFLQFILTAAIFSAVSFFALSILFKAYRADTLIIMLPKNEQAASDAERIIGNLETLPGTVALYEKMIKDSGRADSFSTLSEKNKEAAWNRIISIERKGSGSIVQLSVTASTPEKAVALSKDSFSALLGTMSYYYDIKNDIDIRIIEGPFAINTFEQYWPAEIFGSIVVGLLLSLLLDRIVFIFSRKRFKKRESLTRIQSSFPSHWNEPIQDEPVYEIQKKEEKRTLEHPKAVFPQPSIPESKLPDIPTPEKKSSAPENLPFIDEDYFRSTIIKSAAVKKEEQKKEIPSEIKPADTIAETILQSEIKKETPSDIHREPTKEELKKRLNQLLRGEL